MQNKFRQPVSMQVTKEQYEKDLREPLLRMGYEEFYKEEWEDIHVLVTNYENTRGEVSNTSKWHKESYNRHFIDHYNPKLFLAIAAMTDREFPIVGEWFVYTDNMVEQYGYEAWRLYKNENPNMNVRCQRKATLKELITYFTENKQENIMKKEITTELIEELKGLIAPENEERFNKLMGIEKPKFKKEDFITGDKVVLGNGKTYLVIRDCNVGEYGAQVFALLQCEIPGGFMNSDAYDDNLNDNEEYIEYDIMKIYRLQEGRLCSISISNDLTGYDLIWSRE